MARSIIPEGKKRYAITLTQENHEWLSEFVVKICKQHRSQVSVVIDGMIGEMKESLDPIIKQAMASGKPPTWADFLIMLGRQIQKIGADQSELPL